MADGRRLVDHRDDGSGHVGLRRGLAKHAALPTLLAGLIASVAAILEVHMRALGLTDDNARVKHGACERLVDQRRTAADQRRATGVTR